MESAHGECSHVPCNLIRGRGERRRDPPEDYNYVHYRDEEDDNLHDDEITSLDRLDRELADARPSEHRLHDHGTSEQVTDLKRCDGDDRDGGVAKDVVRTTPPGRDLEHVRRGRSR